MTNQRADKVESWKKEAERLVDMRFPKKKFGLLWWCVYLTVLEVADQARSEAAESYTKVLNENDLNFLLILVGNRYMTESSFNPQVISTIEFLGQLSAKLGHLIDARRKLDKLLNAKET